MSLCYRCEWRALYHETGHGPRCECGMIDSSKYGCYMYKPIKPVITKPDDDELRPRFSNALFSSREYFDSVNENFKLSGIEYDDGKVSLYWKPDMPLIKEIWRLIIIAFRKWRRDIKDKKFLKKIDELYENN